MQKCVESTSAAFEDLKNKLDGKEQKKEETKEEEKQDKEQKEEEKKKEEEAKKSAKEQMMEKEEALLKKINACVEKLSQLEAITSEVIKEQRPEN
mmetsp:Transcript_7915/g.7782  ORF Transcript_7915/g.7782 Transcript_7915/m.7782 type:complete len:95 (-) Transcript_7915:1-285(-)|eukprot:CAMPEP_0202945026 /NCGR_PEP_ID=MMETSP1395-20130829/5982_1 /ASSEMBLY_ACC=CAM_ASM_000871 /TAXON_ID=5961 /ORGANISM="Blepharisma japonicum, Strain Stock R1072" /LENGTH=94 /DNA_ID=CAMNT_0049644587 /DNA_START=2044 /DNA_END=2325 /DNA_ORIENTATION=+